MEEDTHNLSIESERMEFEFDAKVTSTMLEDGTPSNSEDSNIMVEDATGDQVTAAKYGRHSWGQKTTRKELGGGHLRRHSSMMIIPSRYLSGSIGSCHDLCKAGHVHDLDEKIEGHLVRPPSGRSVLLRTQSERKDAPKVALLAESCKKKSRNNEMKAVEKPENSHQKLLGRSTLKVPAVNAFRLLKPSVKRAMSMGARNDGFLECPLHGKNQTNHQREANANKPKEALNRKNQAKHQRDAKPKEPKYVPEKMLYMIEPTESTPIKTSQEAYLCEKQSSRSRRGSGNGTREGSNDSRSTSSILPMILMPFKHQAKELQITEMSQGEHRYVVSGDSESEPSTLKGALSTPRSKQSVEQKVEKAELDQPRDKASSTWRKFKEATLAALSPKKPKSGQQESTDGDQNVELEDRKRSYNNRELDREESHGKGAELGEVVVRHHETIEKKKDKEPVKKGKYTVKTLVGAFEALISLGDRRSLVAASAS